MMMVAILHYLEIVQVLLLAGEQSIRCIFVT